MCARADLDTATELHIAKYITFLSVLGKLGYTALEVLTLCLSSQHRRSSSP